ncbi:MAG: hypothetical protein JKY65_23445, partial [Planctomycetes bacterium]|nr:hypothetical protein [Planctomycetota bacterium]
DEADLDEADLDEADLDEEDLDEEDLDDVDLDEDLDDLDDLDDVDLDEDLDDPFEDDPFEDIDLEDAGPPSKKPDSRREPISRQPDGTLAPVSVGAEGSGLVPDTRSERFTLPPDPLAQDDAPVGLVSREDPPAGPTFGSDIMLGSDAGFPGADLGPISFDDDFLSDLEVKPPSASRSGSESEDGISARMVSARFSVRDCTIRWGRGGFPDDSSPAHTLIDFDGAQALFLLDHDDEAAATLQIEDELWVRIEVPAFLEPILTRARILDLVGSAGNGGTTATLEFSELEAHTRRKLERAAAARR